MPKPYTTPFATESRRADRLLAIGGTLLLLAYALSGCAATSSLAGHDTYTHEHATPTTATR
jgi:hypothetical protein